MAASPTGTNSKQKGEDLDQVPPFTILRPKTQSAPIVFASPHSGNHYPKAFVNSSQLDPIALRRSEDAFVDELYDVSVKFGAPLLKANYPRAYVDLNREPFELDPNMFADVLPSYVNTDSARAAAGLGTVAKLVTNGSNIYGDKLNFEEIRNRIEKLYHPYHAALRKLIDDTQSIFGACLLIDCHSMPSIGGPMDTDSGTTRTDIILGDRFASSCAEWVTNLAQTTLEKEGFIVRRNRPYAGGFTTHHYGEPNKRIHTLQIELNRELYMDEENITRLDDMANVKQRLQPLIERLCAINSDRL